MTETEPGNAAGTRTPMTETDMQEPGKYALSNIEALPNLNIDKRSQLFHHEHMLAHNN